MTDYVKALVVTLVSLATFLHLPYFHVPSYSQFPYVLQIFTSFLRMACVLHTTSNLYQSEAMSVLIPRQ